MGKEYFTKKEREQVYKNALRHFINYKKNGFYKGYKTTGMCGAIYDGMYGLSNIESKWAYINKKNFPEFYAFKPKRTWKKNPGYWFTRYISRGGYDKRLSILTALADGKTPEQWKKEWRALGKR